MGPGGGLVADMEGHQQLNRHGDSGLPSSWSQPTFKQHVYAPLWKWTANSYYILISTHRDNQIQQNNFMNMLWASKGQNMISGLVWLLMTCHYKYFPKSIGLCFTTKEKFYWHFLVTTFFNVVTQKKFQSPVGACPKKLISDPACRIWAYCKSEMAFSWC